MTVSFTSRLNKLFKTHKAGASLKKFADIYFAEVDPTVLEGMPDDLLMHHIEDVHTFFEAKKPMARLQIEVVNPQWSTRTIIRTLQPNQPFLVDTLWTELERLEYTPQLSIHPLFHVQRDKAGKLTKLSVLDAKGTNKTWQAESLIQLEIPRLPKQALAELKKNLTEALGLAHAAVDDFEKLMSRMAEVKDRIDHRRTEHPANVEKINFLDWLIDGNFIFLGYRQYDVKHGSKGAVVQVHKGVSLGILRNEEASSLSKPTPFNKLASNLQTYLQDDDFLVVTKGLQKSRVHRYADLDYIGLKQFDKTGAVIAEHRFVGLFTSKAYNAAADSIPIVRGKIAQILGATPESARGSHAYKALHNILVTLPRDELLQAAPKELGEWARTILHVQEQPGVRLLVRKCKHERLVSTLVYLPRDRMNSTVRKKIQAELMRAYNGESISWQVLMTHGPLTEIYTRIRTKPPEPPRVMTAKLEEKIRKITQTWLDDLASVLADLPDIYERYAETFPTSYQERNMARDALDDIGTIEYMLGEKVEFCATVRMHDDAKKFGLKIFNAGEQLELSAILPLLENFGLNVSTEHPSQLRLKKQTLWLHDFTVESRQPLDCEGDCIKRFTDALAEVKCGAMANDPLNALILVGFDMGQLTILRGVCAYLHQLSRRFARDYIHQTLVKHPMASKSLISMFEARLDYNLSKVTANKLEKQACENFKAALEDVSVLDEDRILHRMKDVVMAIVRTNAWQRSNALEPLAFKVETAKIPAVVKPVPYREIFVYHASVEGVHMRFGAVARGGLRWSDRPEDYRTEVLGLAKAQQVKNAIIVPQGSKGGFVLKGESYADRAELMRQVQAAYKIFINGLLCLTDTRMGDKVVPPRKVKSLDAPDPYLVVAADKGTATFSDIANGEAMQADYWDAPKGTKKVKGFWLHDAFASGGSQGYDHKAMGITARGAWECVKHSFKLLGTDIQAQPFTCLGIGDMGGDVFGNGMLLSEQTKLVMAFNHMHIFFDPEPDVKKSYAERKRLFQNPREAGWDNYDSKLISKGGGVFSRGAKSIKLSKEMRQLLDVEDAEMDPNELIHAMLKASVDLIYNGGIGTYVKASTENNITVGDRANDDLRVDGNQLRCKVFGEGGNLGVTQLGRIEAAKKGVLINTDSIDNAAGVNTSDHEVNIKILLADAMRNQDLTIEKRNKLLAQMTTEVAGFVLYDNYLQAQAITLETEGGISGGDMLFRLQSFLEKDEQLDVKVEHLPDSEELERRKKDGIGYTRPEISILIAYAKLDIFRKLLQSHLPEDAALEDVLAAYFPQAVQKQYPNLLPKHPLRREIVATELSSEVVNRMGLTFVQRLRSEAGADTQTVLRAYLVSKAIMSADEWWQRIEGLDLSVEITDKIQHKIKELLEFCTMWLLKNSKHPLNIGAESERLKGLMGQFGRELPDILPKHNFTRADERQRNWVAEGLSPELAQQVALIPVYRAGPDVANLSNMLDLQVPDVMDAYFGVDSQLKLYPIYSHIAKLGVRDHWQRVAHTNLVEELQRHHAALTKAILQSGKSVDEWLASRAAVLQQYKISLGELDTIERPTYAMLVVIVGQVASLLR